MILSGIEIKERLNNGIWISEFDESRLNPNSYNVRLHNELMVYDTDELDMKKDNPTKNIIIPPEGLVLQPGELYLGRTMEHTVTKGLVPMLEGRSSIGRLGLFIHVTAGFGDVGFDGYWTLEIACLKPIRIYPEVEIGQLYYHHISERHEEYKSGKYQGNTGIQSSQLFRDFQ